MAKLMIFTALLGLVLVLVLPGALSEKGKISFDVNSVTSRYFKGSFFRRFVIPNRA